MRNDIKTKIKNRTIKEKQDKKHLSHYIKEANISIKNDNDKEESVQSTKANAQRDAVHNVEHTAKVTAYKSYTRVKNMIKNKESIRNKNASQRITESNTNKYFHSNKSASNKQYETNTKSFFTYKQRINIKENKLIATTKPFIDKIVLFLKSSLSFIKTTTSSLGTLISIGTGGILLIVITLFIGVFASFNDSSVYGATLAPLSDEVLAYTDTITDYAIENDIEEYVTLIQAIMMTESKGLGNDPMDASVFINQPITNPEYSIEIGVKYIANCLNKANVTSPSDTKKIYLAIQGYDFKDDYIIWALNNFDGYSKSNAQVYYDHFLSDGDVNYVNHVMQYYKGYHRIVEVAKSQIGNIGGMKYWSWYGFNKRVEWCACFVSWCANQSGDLNTNVPKFSGVYYGMQWYKQRDLWKDKSYIPSPGDIIFFDWENDNSPDHVGIVEKVENNKIYTIEGNSNDRCINNSYHLNSNVIYGYGLLNSNS